MRKLQQRIQLISYLRRYREDIHRAAAALSSRDLMELYCNQLRGVIHGAMIFGVITVAEFTTLSAWVSRVQARYYRITNQPKECNAAGGVTVRTMKSGSLNATGHPKFT